MEKITAGIVSFLLVAGLSGTVKAASIFDFNAVPNLTGTTFSDTNNGVMATFAALDPANGNSVIPAGFIVQNVNSFVSFSGNSLYENAGDVGGSVTPPGYANLNLQIQFNSALTSLTFPFSTNAGGGAALTLTAYSGGTQVGSPFTVTAPNLIGNGSYYYGNFAFNPGVSFDSIVLGNNFQFALDDLSVTPAAVSGVPEPASMALILFGLAGMLAYVRRHMARRRA